ncbi:MAG: hypothetical protein INR63_19095 [Actinomycetospora chiangmaiensis]|nr:hypothetical protein [Actinomycetospora chiangmaiensis]
MGRRDPGTTHRIARLGPGTVYLMDDQSNRDLALIVSRAGRREALMLNRRDGLGGDLPLVSDLAMDAEVTVLRGAFLAPAGPLAATASGPRVRIPAALHFAESSAFLCGRDQAGQLATFDVQSGAASAIDVAGLPQAARWRVMIPQAGGVVTVYAAEPG